MAFGSSSGESEKEKQARKAEKHAEMALKTREIQSQSSSDHESASDMLAMLIAGGDALRAAAVGYWEDSVITVEGEVYSVYISEDYCKIQLIGEGLIAGAFFENMKTKYYIDCSFTPDQQAAVKNISKGDTVEIKGHVKYIWYTVNMTNCAIK